MTKIKSFHFFEDEDPSDGENSQHFTLPLSKAAYDFVKKDKSDSTSSCLMNGGTLSDVSMESRMFMVAQMLNLFRIRPHKFVNYLDDQKYL